MTCSSGYAFLCATFGSEFSKDLISHKSIAESEHHYSYPTCRFVFRDLCETRPLQGRFVDNAKNEPAELLCLGLHRVCLCRSGDVNPPASVPHCGTSGAPPDFQGTTTPFNAVPELVDSAIQTLFQITCANFAPNAQNFTPSANQKKRKAGF